MIYSHINSQTSLPLSSESNFENAWLWTILTAVVSLKISLLIWKISYIMSFALGANPMICIGIVRHFTHVPRAFKAKKLATARCGRFCGSLERHFWYAWEICRGANAILSSKIVIWGLTKDSRQVKQLWYDSGGEEHSNTGGKYWLVLASPDQQSIWRLLLG